LKVNGFGGIFIGFFQKNLKMEREFEKKGNLVNLFVEMKIPRNKDF